jgi:phosphate-selective porin OprO/OprP
MAVSTQVFAGTVTSDGADIVVKTKGGLEVATTDKEFSFKLGGRLQADYSRFDGFYTKNGETADAAYFRRAFLEISGVAYTDWKYAISYDFAHNAGNSDDGYFDEASIAYTGFKPFNLKFGRFDPDFGLEKATSSKSITAIERNAAYEVADWVNGHETALALKPVALPVTCSGCRAVSAPKTPTIQMATASSSSTCAVYSRRWQRQVMSCMWASTTPAETSKTVLSMAVFVHV